MAPAPHPQIMQIHWFSTCNFLIEADKFLFQWISRFKNFPRPWPVKSILYLKTANNNWPQRTFREMKIYSKAFLKSLAFAHFIQEVREKRSHEGPRQPHYSGWHGPERAQVAYQTRAVENEQWSLLKNNIVSVTYQLNGRFIVQAYFCFFQDTFCRPLKRQWGGPLVPDKGWRNAEWGDAERSQFFMTYSTWYLFCRVFPWQRLLGPQFSSGEAVHSQYITVSQVIT